MKILVLPGLDGTGRLLTDFAASLGRSYAVEVVSYLFRLTSYDEICDWLRPRLPQDDFVIVAESFSGPVAIGIASQRIPRLLAVVFVASFARAPRKIPSWLVALLRYLPHLPGVTAVLSRPFVTGKAASKALLESYHAVLREVPKRTVIDRLRAVLQVDQRGTLAEIKLPCAFLRATGDRLVPEAVSRDFAGHCQILPPIDAPHFVLQTKPEVAAARISTFISALEGRAAASELSPHPESG